MTITCPAGEVEDIEFGVDAAFDSETCAACALRPNCTTAKGRHGRTIQISKDEHLQAKLRKLQATNHGRERLRQRTAVEHTLAHLGQRQGRKARYRGVRKNVFDVRRAAVIQNLEIIGRRVAGAVSQAHAPRQGSQSRPSPSRRPRSRRPAKPRTSRQTRVSNQSVL